MICTSKNLILAQVEDRAAFLRDLIEEYPRLLSEWTERTDMSFKEVAEEYAEGDSEVYHDTYRSFLSAFDEKEYREDMFYKAMLIIVYSYYDGVIEYLGGKTKSDDQIEQICKDNNIELSEEAKEAKERLKMDIRNLRNHLVHNNLMSSKQSEHIKRISKKWPEIQFSDDDVMITGSDFIIDSLNKEELVLKELCDKLGYKHIRVKIGKT